MKIFTPLNSTIMILRDETAGDKLSEGGILLPGRAVEIANEGEVRAVPNERFDKRTGELIYSPSVEVGDRVVFTKYAGSEFELNGVTYVLLKETELQGVTKTVYNASTDAVHQTAEDVNAAAQKALAELEKQANQ